MTSRLRAIEGLFALVAVACSSAMPGTTEPRGVGLAETTGENAEPAASTARGAAAGAPQTDASATVGAAGRTTSAGAAGAVGTAAKGKVLAKVDATLNVDSAFMATLVFKKGVDNVSCKNIPEAGASLLGWDDASKDVSSLAAGRFLTCTQTVDGVEQNVSVSAKISLTGTEYFYPNLQYRMPDVHPFAPRGFARSLFSAFVALGKSSCSLDGDPKGKCDAESSGTIRMPSAYGDRNALTIKFGGTDAQPKATLHLQVTSCGYHATNSVPLVPKAWQRMSLDTAKSCPGPDLPAGADLKLVSGNYSIAATVERQSGGNGDKRQLRLTIPNVPADIPVGDYQWDVVDGDHGLVATARIPMAGPMVPDGNIEVRYNDERDRLHDGKSQTALVVGASNTVHLVPPVGLDDSLCNAGTTRTVNGERSEPPCWNAALEVDRSAAAQGSLRRLTFDIKQQSGSEVYASLVHMTAGVTTSPAVADIILRVKLADLARNESVPYPIAKRLYVYCGERVDTNDRGALPGPLSGQSVRLNEVGPIMYDDLANGFCGLYFYEGGDTPSLSKYGQQILNVTVEHEGTAAPFRVRTVLSPDANDSILRRSEPQPSAGLSPAEIDLRKGIQSPNEPLFIAALGAPAGDKDSGVPYVVRVTLGATVSDDRIVYRSGTKTQVVDGEAVVWTNQVFQARLRSSGQFAWFGRSRKSIRTYITIPVDVAGIRFKAAPRDMKSSGDPTSYQFTGIRTGALLAIEPWSHVLGRNWLALGPRVLVGLHGYGADTSKLGMSFVSGVGLSMPLLQNDTLETSVGVQAYYERDLRQGGGNHVLITGGLNVFSFLSAH